MALTDFNGACVVITGASAGVGAACARAFAREGAKLVLVARGRDALEAIAVELREQTEVLAVTGDVADPHVCDELVRQARETFGAIDVLINNAGLHHRGEVGGRTPAEIAAMVDVNLRAPLYLTTQCLPAMLQAGRGAVVMVGSLAGRAPLQGAATYGATKAGLRSFAWGLADEVRDAGISVGVVSPGP
ncbi:MAG: SDR family oxidoreductase, partial [Pseudomonadales bacterium]|nr:SDR family oxidoreductase [Pseudomonadales bacterium]